MRIGHIGHVPRRLGGGRGTGVITAPQVALYRDAPLLDLIAAAVEGTKEFDDVTTAGLPETVGIGADEDRVAVLELIDDVTELDSLGSNADGTVTQVRTVPFRVTLIVREQDPAKQYNELCRLSQVCMNIVNGQSFGEVTVPTMTWLRRKRNSKPNGVDGRATLVGQFVYFVPSWSGRSELAG